MTNKNSLAVAQAKEIARLNEQVRQLKFALSMAQTPDADHWKEKAERVAAENVHLIAMVRELDDTRVESATAMMAIYSHTGALLKSIQGFGYQRAANDLRIFARDMPDPVFYDLLMSIVNQMDDNARLNIIPAVS